MFLKIYIFLQVISHILCSEYAIMEVQNKEAKLMASIRFGDDNKHVCLGVVLGRRTVMTSAPCLNANIPVYTMLHEGFRDGRCSVWTGVKTEEDKNATSIRRCKRFLKNNIMWWSWGSKFEYDYPVNILVDFPLDHNRSGEIMEKANPKLSGYTLCKVYGWISKNVTGESEGKEMKVLVSTVARLVNQTTCNRYYKQRLWDCFPKNQFCVAESTINDKGRILVCDNKLLGVFAKRLPPLYGKDIGNISLYTFASAKSRTAGLYYNLHIFWGGIALLVLSALIR